MGVFDSIKWIVRMAVTVFVSMIIVIILSYAVPEADAPSLRADILAGRAVWAGGFTSETGVVLEESFTQDVADAHMIIPRTLDREKVYRFAVRASLTANGEDLGTITYNPEGGAVLLPQQGLGNVHTEERVLPVAVDRIDGRRQAGELVVEVLYVD